MSQTIINIPFTVAVEEAQATGEGHHGVPAVMIENLRARAKALVALADLGEECAIQAQKEGALPPEIAAGLARLFQGV